MTTLSVLLNCQGISVHVRSFAQKCAQINLSKDQSLSASAHPIVLHMQMAYNIDVVKTNVPEALEVLLDAVANPAFHNWELQEQIKRLTKDIENAKNNPQSLLMEVCAS